MLQANRPLSPHLQVYRPQLTSILSIMHRVTGLALSIGTVILVWWLLAAASAPEDFATVQGFLGSWIGILLLVAWTYALFFHLCNGIRHLAWDGCYGYDLPTTYRSGWAVVAASAALTVAAVVLGAVMLAQS